jgi:hypothetical protein
MLAGLRSESGAKEIELIAAAPNIPALRFAIGQATLEIR